MNVYVGTYHKYNCGNLDGQWFNLDDYAGKEDFLRACHELHKDENDPEIMFQDFEEESDWEHEFYSESYISSNYWEIKAELKGKCVTAEVFSAWASMESQELTIESVSKCYEQYRGQWETLSDYVCNHYEETGELNQVPEFLRAHINFESIAKDWQLGGDVTIQNGHVFSR